MDLLKGNGLPYIANLQIAVQELLQNTNPQGGFKMAQQALAQQEPPVQTATPAPPADQAAPAAGQTAPAANAGTTPSVAPNAPEQAKQANPSVGSAGTNQAAPPATNKRLDDPQKIPAIAAYVSQGTGVDQKVVEQVLQFLLKKNGLIDINANIPAKKQIPNAATGHRGPVVADESLKRKAG
jgi:hypothetical protein